MDRVRFEALLAAYGGDPRRWPEAERADAESYAATNAEARSLLDDARRLDGLLDATRGEAPGLDLVAARILAAAPKAGEGAPSMRVGRPLVALAACALIGIIIGFGGARLAPPADAADAALNAAFGEGPEQSPDAPPGVNG